MKTFHLSTFFRAYVSFVIPLAIVPIVKYVLHSAKAARRYIERELFSRVNVPVRCTWHVTDAEREREREWETYFHRCQSSRLHASARFKTRTLLVKRVHARKTNERAPIGHEFREQTHLPLLQPSKREPICMKHMPSRRRSWWEHDSYLEQAAHTRPDAIKRDSKHFGGLETDGRFASRCRSLISFLFFLNCEGSNYLERDSKLGSKFHDVFQIYILISFLWHWESRKFSIGEFWSKWYSWYSCFYLQKFLL